MISNSRISVKRGWLGANKNPSNATQRLFFFVQNNPANKRTASIGIQFCIPTSEVIFRVAIAIGFIQSNGENATAANLHPSSLGRSQVFFW